MTGPYLLDTSTILWALAAPERLSAGARDVFSGDKRVVVSVASYWEVVIKVRKGQLSIPDLAGWWQAASKDLGASVVSIRADHVSVLQTLPEHHRDPFDRILIAQAIADRSILVTCDEMIQRYPVPICW